MVVELRTLRITSDFNAASYVAGMNQKVEADRAGAQSSKAAGAAVDDLKIKVSSAVPLIERLSRTYIDGYGSAAKFNTEITRLARSQDTNAASAEHLELIYTGLTKKFGLAADATALAQKGYTGLATAIENVNARLSRDNGATEHATALAARMDQLRQTFDPAYVASQRLSSELGELAEAERLGVQITGGYERALESIILKHDAVAAAAKRQREEYTRLAQEGRDAAAADRAQSEFNSRLGLSGGAGLRASDSAAVFSEQLGRQEEIARLRAQQQAEQFAADLRQRFSTDGSGTSARDSASVFSAEFARQDEINRLRAQQQGSAFSSDLNARLGVNGFGTSAKASATAFEEAARAAEELDRKTTMLRAQIDPLGAAQARLNAEMADYEDLARRNAISSDELAKAQIMARQRYDASTKEIERQGKRGVSGLPSYQLTNLMYQGTDVVQSLALGMPAMQIILQQGPQVAQIFAANSEAMTAMLGALTPVNIALGGVAAAALIGAKAWNDYLKSIKEVETAASGIGRATAGTPGQMEEAARAGAAAAGITVASARSMEAQFLRTGRIGSEQFEDLIGLSKNFAATVGIDASSAGGALADMFSDPAKAAQILYQQYVLINAATARQATNLAAQNRQSEAQALLIDALPARLASAAEATTALGRAWNFVSTSAGNAMDSIGSTIDRALSGPSLDERLAEAQKTRQQLSSGPFSLLQFLSPGNALKLPGIGEEADLNEQIRRRNAQQFREQQRAQDIARSRVTTGYADSSGANADAVRAQNLRNEIEALRIGRDADGIDTGRVDAAIEAKTRVLDALINRQQRSTELDRLDIQIQNERNPLYRAELEARRAALQMADQEISASKISEEAARARNRVIEETIAGASAQAKDMQVELDARTRLNTQVAAGTITTADANRMLQEELSLRPLVIAAAAAEGQEKARLQTVIRELRDGYAGLAAQQKEEAALGIVKGQNEKLESLRAEIMLVGESDEVRRRSIALLQAEQQIRREGIAGTSRADEIRKNAIALADETAALERMRDAWGEVKNAVDGVVNSGVDKLIEGDWSGALKDVSKEITGMLTTIGIKNPIANGIDGGNRGTIADVGGLGGIVSRLFGGAGGDPASIAGRAMGQSVGAMNVTAGTVTITGGIGGVAGSLLGGKTGSPFDAILGGANDNKVGGYSGLSSYAAAIKSIESAGSGGYSALGPITRTGDRAYGAYQIMGANIGPWSKEALGRSISSDEFLRNPALQDQIFNSKFGSYVSRYGPSGAAQAWFGGPGSVGGSGRAADMLGTTGNAYVEKFNTALGKMAANTDVAAGGLGTLGSGFDQFGKSLTGMFPAAPSAPSGGGGGGLFGWLGSLFGGATLNSALSASPQFASAWASGGIGLYAGGGYTGPGAQNQPRGVVHAGEVVWSQSDIARAGGVATVEAMRLGLTGYARGGAVDWNAPARMPVPANVNFAAPASPSSADRITINNYGREEVRTEESTDQYGRRQTVITVGEMTAAAVSQRGNPLRRSLQSEFGMAPRKIAR
jgi:hypothetical protein